jgi:DNA repair exonuclease SbcCD nuclease subunit
MSRSLLRWIHASDLQLHRQLSGLANLPDELRSTLIDAPLTAARGIFDAAITNAVDFVLLAGGVIDAQRAAPFAVRFLVDQFQRLHERKIRVYWAGGPYDSPEHWPAGLALPQNVFHFAADKVDAINHDRDGQTLAIIAGGSNPKGRMRIGEFKVGRDGILTIAVAATEASAEELSRRGIHYWALGGRNSSATPALEPHIIHYPGAPQGFTANASGKHGATLVVAEESGSIRLQPLTTDVVRWHDERLAAAAVTSDEELYRRIADRITQLTSGAPEKNLMIRWTLAVDELMTRQLNSEGLAKELLERLRKNFGQRRPAAWSYALAAEPRHDVAGELYEEDTILGDFLRSLREYRQSPKKRLDLDSLLHSEVFDSAAGQVLRCDEEVLREQLLREVATLGIERLCGASLTESGAAKINFRGGAENKSLSLKHDGQGWKAAHSELVAVLDEVFPE